MNYVRKPSEVTPVELNAYMLGVVKQETSVSLSLSHEKKKKKMTQILTKPKPNSKGPDDSGALPKETLGTKAKTKKTTLKQATLILTKMKVSTRGTEKSHSVSTDQPSPSNSERNTQLSNTGTQHQYPKDGTRKSPLFPEGTPIPIKVLALSTKWTKPNPPYFRIQSLTTTKARPLMRWSWILTPPIISTLGQFQALMKDPEEEVMEFSDEEILDVGDDMDTKLPKATKESSEPPEQSQPHP
ncbi:hypothetical protein Tco_0654614 [Tanacetum coccineum]|uniref:Uncharacterized protein n=1 Tax=Tanacetum coccineum TaxID=301880 RepID=A0ABQ4X4M3_9ASTR